MQLRRGGGLTAALPPLLQQRGVVAEAPAASESTVNVGDSWPPYQQVTFVNLSLPLFQLLM